MAFSFHKIKHFKPVPYLPILAKLQFSFLKLEIFLMQQRERRGAGKGLHALPAVPSLAVQWK